jgi:catechol 2,3-dioxygenase
MHRIPNNIRMEPPVLRIKNIEEVTTFYERFGLQINKKYQNKNGDILFELGFRHGTGHADEHRPLVILHHDPNARYAPRHSAGLFHFATLVPDRKSLASTYLTLRESGVEYDGFADHLVSESLYLRDTESNGIEIYRDRPSTEWPRDSEGHIMMDTLPLDLDALVSEELHSEEQENAKAFPSGGRIGHMHLRVTNLERSIKFYHEKLGLDITVNWSSMGAAFLSAGGYHHHIGINIWNSLNGDAHILGVAGLEYFTITTHDRSYLNMISSIIYDPVTPKQQKKQSRGEEEEVNKMNQILIKDPDGIQILIKSE